MKSYDHQKIEKKWQKEWAAKKTYKTLSAAAAKGKKPFYVLDMFPYPSGAGLHVGHPRGYIGSDVIARKKRMEGYNVLHPMGYDAFGLPAEQYAIANKIHPRKAVEVNVKTFEGQLGKIGFSYDWSRAVNTTDPEYYKWTQWIFLKIYNSWFDPAQNKARPIAELETIFEKQNPAWKGMSALEKQAVLMQYRLAYEGHSEVNWCPEMGTVLANDEIVDGPDGPVSERGGYPVEKRSMRQWFMRITAYGDRLIADLDGLAWPEHIKEIQRNWIGKSEGSEIDFAVHGSDAKITVFTTRADTLYGVTYVVLAPEHPLLDTLASEIKNLAEVKAYIKESRNKDEMVRTALDKPKTGVELRGISAINPINGEAVPVWIGDYVLPGYGTGAVMAVPAHDERDRQFAETYNLHTKNIPADISNKEKYTVEAGGRIVTKYKFRDAVFARQRYWGEPIPLSKDQEGLIHEVAEKKLPLELPNVKTYEPSGTGESPLASVAPWVKAGYETNTMPGWAGSSWYFLRYADPKNKKAFASEKELAYWFNEQHHGGVDVYVGGAEHATGHLLYSRFWHKVLYDYGFVPTKEPFQLLRNQGIILASDGRKMSKRWGNVINPDEIVATYGADTLRLYEMFMGPFDASLPWSTESIIGSRRFIERVWRLAEKVVNVTKGTISYEQALHKAIKKVSEDIEDFGFNTAVSAMMICLNEMEKSEHVAVSDFEKFLQLLAPFAPHVAEELWYELGGKKSIHVSGWPSYDADKLVSQEVTIVVQVNSKNRGEITVSRDTSEHEVKALALAEEKVVAQLAGQTPKKVIYVPGRLVNIVL
jgi:leucyl-tRNA synthetase